LQNPTNTDSGLPKGMVDLPQSPPVCRYRRTPGMLSMGARGGEDGGCEEAPKSKHGGSHCKLLWVHCHCHTRKSGYWTQPCFDSPMLARPFALSSLPNKLPRSSLDDATQLLVTTPSVDPGTPMTSLASTPQSCGTCLALLQHLVDACQHDPGAQMPSLPQECRIEALCTSWVGQRDSAD
jgi:hypothetical protein